MYRSISGLILLLVLFCSQVMALESDRQQKIYIESNELEIDEAGGVSEYRGAVTFTRGSLHLTADKVRIYEKEGELQKLLAWGEPVHIRQQLNGDRGETRAVAQRMEYIAASDRLFLYGQAHLWQDGNEFSGDVIEYHLAEEKVVARGDAANSGRVHIVIEPSPGGDAAAPASPADRDKAGDSSAQTPAPADNPDHPINDESGP